MKRLLALAVILLAVVACENPVDHFTKEKGKKIVIDCGELDLSDPTPVDTFTVSGGKCGSQEKVRVSQ